MVKVGDRYILHSENGTDYDIEIVNINEFREPNMKYGADVYDSNGVYAGDVTFFGDDFLNKCEKVDIKEYIVDAKTSEDSMGNYIQFYKEDGKIWIGIGSQEERGFTDDEVNEIIEKLKECIND